MSNPFEKKIVLNSTEAFQMIVDRLIVSGTIRPYTDYNVSWSIQPDNSITFIVREIGENDLTDEPFKN